MTSPVYKELTGGFTSNFVRRIGNQVVKSGPTVGRECKWYHAYKDKADIPHIYSADPGGMNMEFIPTVGTYTVDQVLFVIEKYKDYSVLNDLKFYAYRHRITEHLQANPLPNGGKLIEALKQIDLPATFCHGDLSVRNIIPTHEGIKLIDPLYCDNFGSYWLDYAKFAFSLKFYNGDISSYNEVMARTGCPKVLIASECVRVATYNERFNFISENLVNEL